MKIVHSFFYSLLLITIQFVYADETSVSEKSKMADETQITEEAQTTESSLTEAAQKGQALHERHCEFCHARLTNKNPGQLYTRPNHRVQNYTSLENKVLTCVNSLGIPWFEDEMANVTAYLNEVYYQFNVETP